MVYSLLLGLTLTLSPAGGTFPQTATVKGAAVAYPWAFKGGTGTAQKTALEAAASIAQKAGFSVISGETAIKNWRAAGLQDPDINDLPSTSELAKFAQRVGAKEVLYGTVRWHTRSIWVGAGPKTISTATANVYVFDASSRKIAYKKTGVEGRSDEKENTAKVAAAILVTPLVTAVSGGPATPREQRAVQIALGRAYAGWRELKR